MSCSAIPPPDLSKTHRREEETKPSSPLISRRHLFVYADGRAFLLPDECLTPPPTTPAYGMPRKPQAHPLQLCWRAVRACVWTAAYNTTARMPPQSR